MKWTWLVCVSAEQNNTHYETSAKATGASSAECTSTAFVYQTSDIAMFSDFIPQLEVSYNISQGKVLLPIESTQYTARQWTWWKKETSPSCKNIVSMHSSCRYPWCVGIIISSWARHPSQLETIADLTFLCGSTQPKREMASTCRVVDNRGERQIQQCCSTSSVYVYVLNIINSGKMKKVMWIKVIFKIPKQLVVLTTALDSDRKHYFLFLQTTTIYS